MKPTCDHCEAIDENPYRVLVGKRNSGVLMEVQLCFNCFHRRVSVTKADKARAKRRVTMILNEVV